MRGSLQALINDEYSAKIADAMQREDPAERDAILERLSLERAARLDAALIECDLQAGDEKEATIRSLADEHAAEAKQRRDGVHRPSRIEKQNFAQRAPG